MVRKSYTAILRDKRPSHRNNSSLAEWLSVLQGSLFLLMGIWPIAHITSFIGLTGEYLDPWAIQTIGALQIAIGCVLLVAALRSALSLEVGFLLMGSSLALGFMYLAGLWRYSESVYVFFVAMESLLMGGLALAFLPRFIRKKSSSFSL